MKFWKESGKMQIIYNGNKIQIEEGTRAKEILKEVYNNLKEKGYNPINQIVGYLMSGDPGYISSYIEARNKITEFDRTKILEILVSEFLNNR